MAVVTFVTVFTFKVLTIAHITRINGIMRIIQQHVQTEQKEGLVVSLISYNTVYILI